MDDRTFRQLILSEHDAVYRLACHLSSHRQEAEDLLQETYLRALKFADTFALRDHGVRPWLFKILHNVIATRGAKRQRERAVMDGLRQADPRTIDGMTDGVASHRFASGRPIDWDHVDERLKAAVADLPLPQREVFLLSAVEGLRYREIADVTGLPIGTVMSRLSRTRAALAERLSDLSADYGLAPRPAGEPSAEEGT